MLTALADGAGVVLAFVLAWAALFVFGPVACFALLVLQVAGAPAPAGAAWIYGATAGAWLGAFAAWMVVRALRRIASRVESAVAAWFAPFRRQRRRRVLVVDAATGMPLPGQAPFAHPVSTQDRDFAAGASLQGDWQAFARAATRRAEELRQRVRPGPPQPAPGPARPRAAQGRADHDPAAPGRQREPPQPDEFRGRATAPPPHPPPRSAAAPPPPPGSAGPRRPAAPPPPPARPAPPDAWTILGVPRGASADAVRKAYRDLIKQYHPDRVAGMPKEFQSVAHDRTREIRAAYETLQPARR